MCNILLINCLFCVLRERIFMKDLRSPEITSFFSFASNLCIGYMSCVINPVCFYQPLVLWFLVCLYVCVDMCKRNENNSVETTPLIKPE